MNSNNQSESASGMSSITPTTKITLNDGQQMPLLGLGTFQAPKGQTEQVVSWALAAGYRHIDCADFYENEDEVGEALAKAFASGTVKREDVFITTKVWPNWYGPGRPTRSVQRSLKNLRLEYVDLLLIHWPTPLAQQDDHFYPLDDQGQCLLDETIQLEDVWQEFIEIRRKGLARSIGVSNFNTVQIRKLADSSSVVPSVNQVECHPYLSQESLLKWCKSEQIVLTAYSPLARSGTAEAKNSRSPLEEPVILAIAQKHGVSAAQVIIRWQLQRGVVVIPKSSTRARIESNFNVWHFELGPEEMDGLAALNSNTRNNTWRQYGIDRHSQWPFAIEF